MFGCQAARTAGHRIHVVATVDWNPLANQERQAFFPHIPLHDGDVNNAETLRWIAAWRPDVITGGWPCPPTSTMGDRAGEDDSRFGAMISALRIIFLSGAQGAYMECVEGFATYQQGSLVAQIDTLCSRLGWHFHSMVIPLHNVMPNRRTRWIGFFAQAQHGSFALEPWPQGLSPSRRHRHTSNLHHERVLGTKQ